jgi:putative transcription factor
MDNILIDGAQLIVCAKCKKYGTVVRQRGAHHTFSHSPGTPQGAAYSSKPKNVLDIESVLAYDYNKRIQRARGQLGLSQYDLAKQLNEKKSTIAHLELGELRPDEKLRKKLERALKIELREKLEE